MSKADLLTCLSVKESGHPVNKFHVKTRTLKPLILGLIRPRTFISAPEETFRAGNALNTSKQKQIKLLNNIKKLNQVKHTTGVFTNDSPLKQ